MIAAINASPGQVDDGIGAVDFRRPSGDRRAVPVDYPPGSLSRVAAEHDHLMAVSHEGTCQYRADLPGSAWYHDLHVSSLRRVFFESLSQKPQENLRHNTEKCTANRFLNHEPKKEQKHENWEFSCFRSFVSL